MPNILLGITGSVASILTQDILTELDAIGTVRVVMTEHARYFATFPPYSADVPVEERRSVYGDKHEWQWKQKGDPILHIELRQWADVFVIAPCSAHTLAKIANGLADNLLTSVARAWNWKKPMVLAPSMNTEMLNHPVTNEHLAKVERWGARIIAPQCKTLACGEVGNGALANIKDIGEAVTIILRANECIL